MASFDDNTAVLATHPLTNMDEQSTFKVRAATHYRTLVVLMVLGLGVGATGTVSAAKCEDLVIKFKNATKDEIRISEFKYFDNGEWKEKPEIFGEDGFQRIEPGQQIPARKNLRGVGGDETRFRVTYQHHKGGAVWGQDKVETTEKFLCTDKREGVITLDK